MEDIKIILFGLNFVLGLFLGFASDNKVWFIGALGWLCATLEAVV